MTPAAPTLSVVVVAFNETLQPLQECLRALDTQRVAGGIEVIVVRAWRSGEAAARDELARHWPHVTWLAGAQPMVPHLRWQGVAASRGGIVALIEDDCMVDAEWAHAVLRAHEGEHAAVGGAVEPGGYDTARDWAAFLCDYSRYMPPFTYGESSALPGNNVSYKRRVVGELLAMTERDGLQETFVHGSWASRGTPMLADPRIVVRNVHRWAAADLSTVPFHHARAFGGRRARDWSLPRRVLSAAATAALPLLHVARIAARAGARPRMRGPLMRALPWISVFGVAWAAGECLGYAAGPGDSLRKWR